MERVMYLISAYNPSESIFSFIKAHKIFSLLCPLTNVWNDWKIYIRSQLPRKYRSNSLTTKEVSHNQVQIQFIAPKSVNIHLQSVLIKRFCYRLPNMLLARLASFLGHPIYQVLCSFTQTWIACPIPFNFSKSCPFFRILIPPAA